MVGIWCVNNLEKGDRKFMIVICAHLLHFINWVCHHQTHLIEFLVPYLTCVYDVIDISIVHVSMIDRMTLVWAVLSLCLLSIYVKEGDAIAKSMD